MRIELSEKTLAAQNRKGRILFFVPPFPARTYPGKTMGQDYLAGTLVKSGHEVEIIGLDVLGTGLVESSIGEFNPDMVGISYLSFQTDNAVQVANKVHELLAAKGRRGKQRSDYVPIVMGGAGAENSHEIIEFYENIEAWCYGEGFNVITDIVDAALNGNFFEARKSIRGISFFDFGDNKAVRNPPALPTENLDEYLPLRLHHYREYDFDEIFGSRKTAQMMTSIGCRSACFFCHESVKGKRLRERSVESVRQELYRLVEEGYRAVYFDDSTFTQNRERALWIIEVLGALHKEHGIVWGFNTRVDCLDFELIKRIKESGCAYMFAGVESLIPEVLLGMNKISQSNFDYLPIVKTPEEYIERARKVYTWMGEAGLVKSCFLIFGGPKFIKTQGGGSYGIESFEDAKKTIEQAVYELNPEYISINVLRFIPNSIFAVSRKFAGLRGSENVIHGGYYSAEYKATHGISMHALDHPIYLAYESASNYYPIPPHMTPEYCYQILDYLVKTINEKNAKSQLKTKLVTDKEFWRYLKRGEYGTYALARFEEMGAGTK